MYIKQVQCSTNHPLSFDKSKSRLRRERHFVGNFREMTERSSNSRSGSRTSTNRDSIRCFRCREYDHFAIDCPNMKTAHIS